MNKFDMRLWLFLLSLTGFNGLLFATTQPFPDVLMYQGQPIDPLCLTKENQSLNATVDLKTCSVHSKPLYTTLGTNARLTTQGYYGYEYSVRINPTVKLQGYSYYKIIANVGDEAVVQTLNHGGGTGEPSSLLRIRRKPHNILQVKILSTGDRCNHGLIDAHQVNPAAEHVLLYRQKQTSYDFLTLTKGNPHHLQAFTDLMDCAICCKAVAVYQYTLANDAKPAKLLYVDLTAFPQSQVDTTQPHYQVCFDTVFQDYLKSGQTKLDAQQLVVFMQKVYRHCSEHG